MYQNSTFWHFETRVLIMLSSKSVNKMDKPILKQFSIGGLFNVAIVRQVSPDQYFLSYDNPFPKNRSSSITTLYNPINWLSAFPNKVNNLHKQELILCAKQDPPGVIFKEDKIFGFDKALYQVMLNQWNATYRMKRVSYNAQFPNISHVDGMTINKFPFYSAIVRLETDIIQANSQDHVRILVRYRKAKLSMKLIWGFFQSPFIFTQHWLFCVYYFLHYLFFHRKTDLPLVSYLGLMPLSVRQPVSLKMRTWKERLFLAAGLVFAFFVVTVCETQLTSRVLARAAEPKLRTIEELTNSDYRIYTSMSIAALLQSEKYNLTEKFLRKLQVVDEQPWERSYHQVNYAYVISMADNEMFLQSPLNVDEFGLERFYLLDHVIATVPMVYLFQHQSPYTRNFYFANLRISEAGLKKYWQVKTLRKDVWGVWGTFQRHDENSLQNSIKYSLCYFAFVWLIIGWAVATYTMVLEILWRDRERYWKMVRSRLW